MVTEIVDRHKGIIYLVLLSIIVHFIATDFTYKKGSTLQLLTKDNYYDFIHHTFKDYSTFHYAKNLITFLFIVPILFNLQKLPMIPKKFYLIIPILIIIRSLFTSVTIFPATRENGPNNIEQKESSFFDYFFGDNYDRMFSGHMCFAIITSYISLKLNLVSLPTIVLLNLIHSFIIVVTRSHYTIDVLNSGIITYLLIKQFE